MPFSRASAAAGPDANEGEGLSTRKKLGFLMLFRVVLITLVLGTTVALNYADPEILLSTPGRSSTEKRR